MHGCLQCKDGLGVPVRSSLVQQLDGLLQQRRRFHHAAAATYAPTSSPSSAASTLSSFCCCCLFLQQQRQIVLRQRDSTGVSICTFLVVKQVN
jgi:hypothetical protein